MGRRHLLFEQKPSHCIGGPRGRVGPAARRHGVGAIRGAGVTAQDDQGIFAADRAQSLDMVLHCCGPEIVYDRIVSALEDPSVYPSDTSLSWNLDEGNPSLEEVLKTTSLRVWGTYPRALLSKAEGAEASVALESFFLKHRAWLEGEGYLH